MRHTPLILETRQSSCKALENTKTPCDFNLVGYYFLSVPVNARGRSARSLAGARISSAARFPLKDATGDCD